MHRNAKKAVEQFIPLKSKPIWVCPQFETLQRMRNDPARFFPGEKSPHYCSDCVWPFGRHYPPECIVWGFYGVGNKEKQSRLRLAKRINRALRKIKNQLHAEKRQRNRRRTNESSRI